MHPRTDRSVYDLQTPLKRSEGGGGEGAKKTSMMHLSVALSRPNVWKINALDFIFYQGSSEIFTFAWNGKHFPGWIFSFFFLPIPFSATQTMKLESAFFSSPPRTIFPVLSSSLFESLRESNKKTKFWIVGGGIFFKCFLLDGHRFRSLYLCSSSSLLCVSPLVRRSCCSPGYINHDCNTTVTSPTTATS